MRHWHGDLLWFQERGSREDCERVDGRRYGKENEEKGYGVEKISRSGH